MAGCERCWARARGHPDRYLELLAESDCSLEDQAGPDATRCGACGRRTVHQYAGVCMACGRSASPGGEPGKEGA